MWTDPHVRELGHVAIAFLPLPFLRGVRTEVSRQHRTPTLCFHRRALVEVDHVGNIITYRLRE